MTLQIEPKIVKLMHFIQGEYTESASKHTFESINPANNETLAEVSLGNDVDINQAVASAKQAYESGVWSQLSMEARSSVLNKIGDLILKNKDLLAQAESLDTGKPITLSTTVDIPRAAHNFHFFSKLIHSLKNDCFNSVKDEVHLSLKEPLGVVGLITPWNLPLYLATWKIAPALAMGNSCVLKPAEWTPYTATLLGDIVNQAGLPKGVLNIVHGYGASGAGEALTKHKDISCISFTGETTTGKAIMKASADTLKKVSFELGGKGANIIFADANLSEAIPRAVKAAFTNQGQICLAGSRLFVEEAIFNQVITELVNQTNKLKVGDPMDTSIDLGSLISQEHCKKVLDYINLGKTEGTILTGGTSLNNQRSNNFILPTIFTDISHKSRLCQEEIFGPVVPVIPFKTVDEAIELANDTPYGLSASLWSSNVDKCHYVANKIKAGIIWINCWFVRDLATPFGGQKLSGIGREGGQYSLDFFSEPKTITYKFGSNW